MMKKFFALSTAALFLLVGCSSGPSEGEGKPTTTTPSSVASTTAPPVEATPEQLASIIAGKLPDLKETIDEAGTCRILWVTGGASVAEDIQAKTCYIRETTTVMTAAIISRDLRELTPPASMKSLYDDTLAATDKLAGIELEAVCGASFDGPLNTDECSRTLGDMYTSFRELDGVLASWGPYL